ncbi:MAG: GntR family transcriptional regulator, partial [Devosia sp.]
MPEVPSPESLAGSKPARSHSIRVVDDLGLAIVSGQRAEGSLLPGDFELLERFGVSRTVLREALKTLAAKGMVQARARVGTRVRPRSSWNLFDPDVL